MLKMKRTSSILVVLAFMMMAPVISWAQDISITINRGWTWLSYPRADVMTLEQAFQGISPVEGDIIKSKEEFSVYSDGQWSGSMSQFTPSIGYMYKSNADASFVFSFPTPYSSDFVTTLNPGWTWISYARPDTLTLKDAFDNFKPSDGDVIKSKEAFSVFTSGAWTGSLTHFTPAQGYMYKSNATASVTFTFPQPVNCDKPTVLTGSFSNIGRIAATCSYSSVTNNGGGTVTERGICWSTSPSPTIHDSHIANGSGTGSFTIDMKVLQAGTTYYVRAYAVNEAGAGYGTEKTLTTLPAVTPPTGALPGLYTVNANGDKVYFSKGNLQYHASTLNPYWCFFNNQWEYLGGDAQGTDDPGVNRDLFCWGTSNYNHGAHGYYPWSISTDYLQYKVYNDFTKSLYDETGQADWGYNRISNGGNQENLWRTPTGGANSEWVYILVTRTTNCGFHYAKATVGTTTGLIIVPDDWSVATYALKKTDNGTANYTSNKISTSDWNTYFQPAGCVFLPCAGARFGDRVDGQGIAGGYWSSTVSEPNTAYGIGFYVNQIRTNQSNVERGGGGSVRLICDYVE